MRREKTVLKMNAEVRRFRAKAEKIKTQSTHEFETELTVDQRADFQLIDKSKNILIKNKTIKSCTT